jgi:hypothetical protein
MILFYSSTREWPDSQVFDVNSEPTKGHLHRITDNKPWRMMEETFEEHRHANEHSRITSYFASATLEESALYMQSQQTDLITGLPKSDNPIIYYRVEIPEPTNCVMKLCDHAMRHIENPAIVAAIAEEYWRPTPKLWCYFEYLGPTMTIIDRVAAPNMLALGGGSMAYENDHATARQRWPLQKKP